jgi:hypothetical protein
MKTSPAVIFWVLLVSSIYADTLYVVKDNPGALPPYDAWTNAASDLQVAVDSTSDGDTILVSNGVFSAGGRSLGTDTTNRVVVTNAISIVGINGPSGTVIRGESDPVTTNGNASIRCLYLGDGARISGFTLTNGTTTGNGGGVLCESTNAIISESIITGNSAGNDGAGVYGGTIVDSTICGNNGTWYGGGAANSMLTRCIVANNKGGYHGAGVAMCTVYNSLIVSNTIGAPGGGAVNSTLYNCVLLGNSSETLGGGAWFCALENCTVLGNYAKDGGGGLGGNTSEARNSIIYSNISTSAPDANYWGNGISLEFCCTTPLPLGPGNITNAPDLANSSDTNWQLSASSPCIDAGTNQEWMIGSTDIDGQVRIFHDRVDIGANEAVIEATSLCGSSIITSSWNTVVGATCQLEFATSPTATVWNTHGNVITATENAVHFVLTNDAATTQMLRLNWIR